MLDIGCGHGENPVLNRLIGKIGILDGVDPFPAIKPHPFIRHRWTCDLQDVPVEPGTFDMAYSFNVVEHVVDEVSFLKRTIELIRPGGIYWSLSPNAGHPFTKVVRAMQALNIKDVYRKTVNPTANNYPALYRLCSTKKILSAIHQENLPIAKVDFFYLHNVQWDSYFPSRLRFLPNLLDKAMILRLPEMSNILMFRIEKIGLAKN